MAAATAEQAPIFEIKWCLVAVAVVTPYTTAAIMSNLVTAAVQLAAVAVRLAAVAMTTVGVGSSRNVGRNSSIKNDAAIACC